jgi:hypothetical protein
MVESMGIKITASGPFEWYHFPTKYHEDLPSSSKVIGEGHRQTGDLISLLSFFESRLKISNSLEQCFPTRVPQNIVTSSSRNRGIYI